MCYISFVCCPLLDDDAMRNVSPLLYLSVNKRLALFELARHSFTGLSELVQISPFFTDIKIATWLILPVVIRSSQRLSHACLSINALYCETANGSLYQL